MYNRKLIKNFFSVDGLDNAIVFETPLYSGLANQLRGLTSAMIMAEDEGRDLYLHWGEIIDLPGMRYFSDLFTQPELPSSPVNRNTLNRIQRFFCFYEGRRILRFTDWIRHELTPHHQFNTILCDMIAKNVNFFPPLIVISSYYSFHAKPINGIDFYDKRHRIYRRFSPAPDIREKYDRFVDRNFKDYTIGVHIRTRKTHKRLTKDWDSHPEGPIGETRWDLISYLIDEEIRKNPDVKIFLAADNITECRTFIERYKERLITHPKETTDGMVNRFSLKDHKDALIDMYLLANTKKLIGTKQSTFSYEAAIMGNVPFVEVSGLGLRQEYTLVDDRRVIIDFRDNGIGAFEKEMTYDKKGGERTSYKAFDVRGKEIIQFFYDELKKIDRPVVFDVGASTGCFSLVAKFVEGSCFYAFEPHELLFDVLKSNLKLNNVENNVRAFNQGLLNESGERDLNVPESGQYLLSTYGQEPKLGKFLSVPTTVETIDSFVNGKNIQKLDFLKIHAGGAGYDILKGGTETLRRFRPNILLQVRETDINQFGYTKKTVIDLLESLRYRHRFISLEHVYCVPCE